MPAGSEDRVAEVESEVHIVPALQVVFGERQADRSDGRVIDERGFGDRSKRSTAALLTCSRSMVRRVPVLSCLELSSSEMPKNSANP